VPLSEKFGKPRKIGEERNVDLALNFIDER
jgi:hypothetical protein